MALDIQETVAESMPNQTTVCFLLLLVKTIRVKNLLIQDRQMLALQWAISFNILVVNLDALNPNHQLLNLLCLRIECQKCDILSLLEHDLFIEYKWLVWDLWDLLWVAFIVLEDVGGGFPFPHLGRNNAFIPLIWNWKAAGLFFLWLLAIFLVNVVKINDLHIVIWLPLIVFLTAISKRTAFDVFIQDICDFSGLIEAFLEDLTELLSSLNKWRIIFLLPTQITDRNRQSPFEDTLYDDVVFLLLYELFLVYYSELWRQKLHIFNLNDYLFTLISLFFEILMFLFRCFNFLVRSFRKIFIEDFLG